jgi:hypothetical protein
MDIHMTIRHTGIDGLKDKGTVEWTDRQIDISARL